MQYYQQGLKLLPPSPTPTAITPAATASWPPPRLWCWPRRLPAEALYPNPARGSVTVQVPEAAGPASITLRDALGRVVRRCAAPAARPYLLDLAGLAPGLYVVQVQAGEELATRQLVVE